MILLNNCKTKFIIALISLNKEKTSSVISFLEKLEDDDDVQHVYANLEINSDFVNKIAT